MEVINLCDTVRLYYLHDTRYKTESLSLHFVYRTDPSENAARYLLPAVLSDGCSDFTDEYSISKKLESLYGADITHKITRMAGCTELCFSLECIDRIFTMRGEDVFCEASKLLFAIIYQPLLENDTFRKSYVDQEKTQLTREVSDLMHRREDYMRVLVRHLAVRDLLYSHPLHGSIGEIRKVSAASMLKAYQDLLSSHMYLVYSGSRSCEAVINSIPTHFFVNHCPGNAAVTYPAVVSDKKVTYRTYHYPIVQTHAAETYVTDVRPSDALWSVYPVFLQLLSDSPAALLFKNVREATSSCYACQAFYDAFCGILTITASVEPGQENRVARAMRLVMDDIQNDQFSEEAFCTAKRAACNSLAMTGDRRDLYDLWLSRHLFLQTDPSLSASEKRLNAVTREDLIAFSNHFQRVASMRMCGTEGQDE